MLMRVDARPLAVPSELAAAATALASLWQRRSRASTLGRSQFFASSRSQRPRALRCENVAAARRYSVARSS